MFLVRRLVADQSRASPDPFARKKSGSRRTPDDDHEDGARNLNPDQAFERIVEVHGGLLWRAASVYEADPELRRDLYQEILTAVWQALPRLENQASLRTYLARIAHNRGVSHVSRAVRLQESALGHEPVSAAPGPEEQTASMHLAARLRSAVHRLPLGWQQVVTLTLEGFPPREIADVLGLSANVVSIRLSRARQALRRALEEGA